MSLIGAALLAPATGLADPEAERLRSANERLASESRSVLLELYALESELGRVEARLAGIQAEAAAVRDETRDARRRLQIVRGTLAEAERRLAQRLRELYTEGVEDPIAVLLGAESLAQAVSTLDNLDRFANHDVAIVSQVNAARRQVRNAVEDLEARSAELDGLAAEAAAAQSSLAAARGEKEAYLARVLRERRLNEDQLARLAARASDAEDKAGAIGGSGGGSSNGGGSDGGSGGSPSSGGGGGGGGGGGWAPPPAPAPATPGTRMTVQSTGYCLRGTTATGVPVGWGIVAVDPGVIPLGTRMTIPGYGEGVAADTGSAVRGAIIDLWFPSCEQAIGWGRRTVTITLH